MKSKPINTLDIIELDCTTGDVRSIPMKVTKRGKHTAMTQSGPAKARKSFKLP